jgi:hypothetical protein
MPAIIPPVPRSRSTRQALAAVLQDRAEPLSALVIDAHLGPWERRLRDTDGPLLAMRSVAAVIADLLPSETAQAIQRITGNQELVTVAEQMSQSRTRRCLRSPASCPPMPPSRSPGRPNGWASPTTQTCLPKWPTPSSARPSIRRAISASRRPNWWELTSRVHPPSRTSAPSRRQPAPAELAVTRSGHGRNAYHHHKLSSRISKWFAIWLPGTAVLFAERGERRDFSDEFRPQRPGQVMAHAGESHEAGVRDGSGDREASARCDERVMEAVDD